MESISLECQPDLMLPHLIEYRFSSSLLLVNFQFHTALIEDYLGNSDCKDNIRSHYVCMMFIKFSSIFTVTYTFTILLQLQVYKMKIQ